jgi:hypothetical protein
MEGVPGKKVLKTPALAVGSEFQARPDMPA